MSENPYNNAIRFQLVEGEECNVWSGRTSEFLVDLYEKDGTVFQIDLNGFEIAFTPLCDGPGDEPCKCFFEDDDEWAEMDCPWGASAEEFMSSGRYSVDLDISEKISLERVQKEIRETVHPEFGAPASLLDLFAFTWILMDEVNGVRTAWEGGQIERPSRYEEDE